jgi:MFS family permease
MSAHQIGLIFFGWGVALAFTSVVVAPRLQHRFGTVPTLLVNLLAMTATLVVMAVGTDNRAVLATCVVVAGLFIGINNTLITETVMKAAPVERGVASAAYSFVRFSGAALAPWLAGVLGEQISVHLPFWVGAAAVLLGAGVLFATRSHLAGIDREDVEESELDEITEQATPITVGNDS